MNGLKLKMQHFVDQISENIEHSILGVNLSKLFSSMNFQKISNLQLNQDSKAKKSISPKLEKLMLIKRAEEVETFTNYKQMSRKLMTEFHRESQRFSESQEFKKVCRESLCQLFRLNDQPSENSGATESSG